jgi:uncharacterized protein YkwD
MKKRIAVISLFVALAALLLATVPAASPALTLNKYEHQLMRAINQKRVKHHLAKVHLRTSLVTAARSHSTEMGAQQYFAHNSPSGECWSARLIRCGYTKSGYSFWRAGENIFMVSGIYAAFPQTAVKAWMKSPAHRRVILTKRFRDIGVGSVMSGDTRYVTLDLGRRIK